MPLALFPARLVCTGQLVAPDAAAVARLLLIAPLLEEWVLRAGLQAWLIRHAARHGRQAAPARAVPVLVSVAAFGLLHAGAGARAVLLVLAPGLVLALLYQRGRDWRWCALLHCGMNALALAGCAP